MQFKPAAVVLSMLCFAGAAVAGPAGRVFDVRRFGAAGDGKTLDTKALQQALDECGQAGGGTVYLPPGTYRAGTLHLRSSTTLYLERGATLQQSKRMDDYDPPGQACFVFRTGSRLVFLHGRNLQHVAIVGGGTIDGNLALDNKRRGPLPVLFENSSHVLMRDVSVVNSPGWAVTFFACKYVDLVRLKCIRSFADGINPVCCQHVLYDGVLVESAGDDPITIKNESPGFLPECGFLTEDIIVANTTVRNCSHPGVKIGTGTAGVFRNISVNNCIFDNTGAMFTIQLMRPNKKEVPERKIENILFSDIIARNVKGLLDITSADVSQPIIRNLTVENVIADEVFDRSIVAGTTGAPVENVTLRNLQLRYQGRERPHFLEARYVNGLHLDSVQIDLDRAVKKAVVLEEVSDFVADSVSFRNPSSRGPLISADQTGELWIRQCRMPDVDTFIHLTGERTQALHFSGCDLHRAANPLVTSGDVPRLEVFPVAARIRYDNLAVSGQISSNESFTIKAHVTNEGASGFLNLRARVNDRTDSSEWVWIGEAQEREVSLNTSRYYKPGLYRLALGNLSATATVVPTPAAYTWGDRMEIVAPAEVNALTRVALSVKNIGGVRDTPQVELLADGAVAAAEAVVLEPGEEKTVALEHRFDSPGPRELRIGDYPPWPFHTFTNTRAHFFQTRDRLIIDAGGAIGSNLHCSGDYSTIYMKDVSGDFVVTARLLSQEVTSAKACTGLVVKNDLTDPGSAGLVVLYIEPKYGSQQAWRGDHDGDGKVDSICYGWGGYPLWFKIEKRGTNFTGYTSAEGDLWHIPQAGTGNLEAAREGVYHIPSARALQDVGIFAYANSPKNELSCTVLDNFRLAKPVPLDKLQFSNLRISQARLGLQDSFTVSATVTNASSVEGPAKVGFYFDRHEPLTRWIDLKPGESKTAAFTCTPEAIKAYLWLVETDPHYIYGDHEVSIGSLAPNRIHVTAEEQ